VSLRLSGGRRLRSPPGEGTRPTASRVRLAVMNLLAAELPGCRWLDLCCGSGVMACEALQRGARVVVAVERQRRIAAVARANLLAVAQGMAAGCPASAPGGPGPARVAVVNEDVLRWLGRGLESWAAASPEDSTENAGQHAIGFDLIYADPPYAAGLYERIGAAVARGGWLRPGGVLLWECSSTAVPPTPIGWVLDDQRRYGSCSVMLLRQQEAVAGA
jgi:16S rRNA (guanine966-N2)-methyltransferase